MRPTRHAVLAVLGVLASLAAAGGPVRGAPGPFHRRASDGTVTIRALPEVLSRPEVRPHLTTGLTTGFVVTVTGRAPGGRRLQGAARIDLRWEPWDEVFYATVVGGDGRGRRETIPSFERLQAWWSALELAVVARTPAEPWQVKVELSVVPFSQSEQLDAQRWFSDTVAAEGAGGRARRPGNAQLDGVVDLLFATSIQRRSIVRYQWAAPRRE